MAAIVRVKRKRDEDPAEALILACKKLKEGEPVTDKSRIPEVTEVLKFAGTIPSKHVSVSSKIRDAIRKEKLQKEYKRHSIDIPTKTRQHVKARAGRSRYQVINSHRAIHLDHLDGLDVECEEAQVVDGHKPQGGTPVEDKVTAASPEGAACGKQIGPAVCDSDKSQKVFCLYDVENLQSETDATPAQPALPNSDVSEITCNWVPMIRERVQPSGQGAGAVTATQGADFVYDLYYTNRAGFDFRALETILRIEAYGEEEFRDDLRDNPPGEVFDDDDDSNDEGNWRNDYPDEDPRYYENDEEDFLYDDGMNENHILVGNGYSLEDYMASRCNLEDGEDLSSDDEEVVTAPGMAPHRSYESYLRSVKQEMEGEVEEPDTPHR